MVMMSQDEIQGLISMDEISDLLLELEVETSILRMTPSDAMNMTNAFDREKALNKIDWLDMLYVLPMRELSNRINTTVCGKNVEFVGLEKLSIRGRMFKIREFLLSKGCSIEQIMSVVPKSQAELNVLLEAKALGFDLGFQEHQTLDNSDRVMRAHQFLMMYDQNNQVVEDEEYGRAM